MISVLDGSAQAGRAEVRGIQQETSSCAGREAPTATLCAISCEDGA